MELISLPLVLLLISNIHGQERQTPQVFVCPGDHVLRGETVNLICVINRGGVSSWQYSWYKDDSIIQQYEQYYTIRSFNESDAGNYTCRGNETNGSRYSDISNAVTLTVSETYPYIKADYKRTTEGSSGLIVGVVVGLIILFFINFLVLLWWYKIKKGKVSWSPSAFSPQQNISQRSDRKQSEEGYTPLKFGKVSRSPSAFSPQQNISRTSDQKQSEDGYTPLKFGKVSWSPSAVSPQQSISRTSDRKQSEEGYTPLKFGKVSKSAKAVSSRQNISLTSDRKQSEDVYTPLKFVHADIYDSLVQQIIKTKAQTM
nr:uncharacterized protein LOC129420999 isoform X1 [Misgurnus anguillicaudatus]XP_055032226.1 uncharacterized protein LOC129420999 isoform X1 [Misgurnus anguillicaudatus]